MTMAALAVVSPVIFLVLCFQVQQVLSVVWCDSISYCQDGYYCCNDGYCCYYLSAGAIAGIVIAILLIIGLAIGIRIWKHKKSKAAVRVVVVPGNTVGATAPPT
ncbi:uncharacterized protein LOC126484572 [Schistocerca serialis cubense]|uniref:uncharacterized protein LOC126262641 n=1 Tax=Schistocerca nitens TaxID=7011 RepID=UPI002118AA5B|nr:uncharacterized protein LOC126262641 [Schistocerca nitens]XP_049964090.1 uncharacterized protein LOC126484572 [Schistocerca serialis cubense]